MTVFNRTFYDLNHERSYCVEGDGLDELCRAFTVDTTPNASDDPPCEPSAICFEVVG